VSERPADDPAARLDSILEAELQAPTLTAVGPLVQAIRRRHGPAVAAVLFYGSCLRRDRSQGVLDLYVLVDAYRPVHRSWPVAILNQLLPPNVFYIEEEADGETVRAKYAVISLHQFQRRAAGQGLDSRIWARFCQPARLVFARDPEARRAAVAATRSATLTAVDRMRSWLPGQGNWQRFRPADLWISGLMQTYRAELRSEQPETIRRLYEEQAQRMDRVAILALRSLTAQRGLVLRESGGWLELASTPLRRRRSRLAWRMRRPLAKVLAILGLAKTPVTFEGWLPYVLWKLERQSGVRIEISDRQRAHPFLWAWPVLFRVLRLRVLR
jgi:hypothetical protein